MKVALNDMFRKKINPDEGQKKGRNSAEIKTLKKLQKIMILRLQT